LREIIIIMERKKIRYDVRDSRMRNETRTYTYIDTKERRIIKNEYAEDPHGNGWAKHTS